MIWSIILLCVMAVMAMSEDTPVQTQLVQTTQGPVLGYRTLDGDYFAFYGIPYATAPVGKQKFMPPLPAPTWEEPLEAIDKGIICPQIEVAGKQQEEDCLIANIFTPDTNQTNLPVLVIVHGGAYQSGYGNKRKYLKVLQTENLVLVNFNYRLAAHGFLCLGTELIPGNTGLKDQIAVLRWVKDNIASFNGNPHDVTIYGQSVGGGSVDLLSLSKAADGLFQKVIVDSGSGAANWASEQNPINKAAEYAIRSLNYTGSTDDINALEEIYVNSPIDLLITPTLGNYPDGSFYFQPCVEKDIGIEMAIDEPPMQILRNGNYRKVPMLYAFTELEGTMRIYELCQISSENFADYMPGDLEFDSEEQKEVLNRVKQLYFGDKEPGISSVWETLKFLSDYMFVQPMLRTIKLHLENGHDQVYLQRYYYFSEDESNELDVEYHIKAAQHTAQSMAVGDFSDDYTESNLTEEYKQLKATIRNFYINFIINGNPSLGKKSLGPDWIPVTDAVTRSPHMFFFNGTVEEVYDQIDKNKTILWDEIYSKYYRYPSPPEGVSSTEFYSSSTSLSSIFCLVILSVVILIR